MEHAIKFEVSMALLHKMILVMSMSDSEESFRICEHTAGCPALWRTVNTAS
jgi:hypothetical protein